MTTIPAPPPGFEILEVEGDPDVLRLDDLRFRSPAGDIVTWAELPDYVGVLTEGEHSGSVMVALYPTPEMATKLAIPRGLPPAEMHMTLAFLGKTAELEREPIESAVRRWAADVPVLEGVVGGLGYFHGNPDSESGVVTYLSLDLPELPHSRETLVEALEGANAPPSKLHGFTPHMTLDYANRRPSFDFPIPISFDAVALSWGDERVSIPLGGGDGG